MKTSKKKLDGNWRDDPGMFSTTSYKKKFALLPVLCHDGSKVQFEFYYKKYQSWSTKHYAEDHAHIDFIENITEAEYMVRKLAETL